MSKQNTGKIGEDIACEYLIKKGYKILARNYRDKIGEIDIVAKNERQTLVFVEVKTFTGELEPARNLMPEDHLTREKLRRLRSVCRLFVARNPDLVNDKSGWQIDLLAINLESGKEPEVRQYKNL